MPNLVDSLILQLKLDASGFQKGQKDAEASLKKTREMAVGHGKGIEQSMRGASETVNKLTLRFLELYAVLTGGKEIKQFISDTTRSDAAIGRFAANMQMSTKDLQAWQGAVKATGGTAEDASSSIQSFSNQIQAIKAGHPDKNFLLSLAQIGGKPLNFQAPINQQIRTLADNLRALYKRDPQFATYMASQVGMSQNMFNTMVREKGALEALLSAEEKYAHSPAAIEAAEKRQTAWQLLIAASDQLGTSILTQLTPTFLRLSTAVQDFIDKHGAEFIAWFQEIADRIEAFPWKQLFDDFVGLAKRVDAVVTGTIGWKTALEALIALKVIDTLTPMAVQFGLIALALTKIVGLGPALTTLFGVGGILAAGGALAATLYPQGLNAGEDARARQLQHGQRPPEPLERPGGFKNASPWNRQTGGAPIGGGVGPSEGAGGTPTGPGAPTNADEIMHAFNAAASHPEWPGPGLSKTVPVTGPRGQVWNVAPQAASSFQAFIDEMNQKHPDYPLASAGGYNNREKRGGGGASMHAYGTAIDINAGRNPWGTTQNDFPADTAEIAARHGIAWGANFSGKKDPMHFEYTGITPQFGSSGAGATKPDLTNNPGDLHFPGTELDYQGLFGGTKSNQFDQGAPLYQFPSLTQGFAAMAALARKKYQQGKTTLNKLIAGQGGLTPGNASAAANIAKSMGIGPDDDLGLLDPTKLRAFQRAYSIQEGSKDAVKWLDQYKGSHLLPHHIGAAMAANVANRNSMVNSHNSTAHEVHVANLNIHTAATDASGIARDIKPAIERTSFAMLGNYSLA